MEKFFRRYLIAIISLLLLCCSTACSEGGKSALPDGGVCGGIVAIADCSENSFCKYSSGSCGANDASGICTKRTEICTQIYAPVCGCDGKTYSSECTAEGAGVSIASTGECR